jgi:hypothetical protein
MICKKGWVRTQNLGYHAERYDHCALCPVDQSWDGLVAGTDGSVDEHTEVMGAGYVLGADSLPIISFFARVGGPLASARAEAASLLQLLLDVRQRYSNSVHLLILVDCLVVLDSIIWGRSDFHPSPKEVVHFAVIYPLLQELRQWPRGAAERLPTALEEREGEVGGAGSKME